MRSACPSSLCRGCPTAIGGGNPMIDWSEFSPAKAILPMIQIHIVAIVITLLVPGSIAKLGHVFYEKETIARLPATAKREYGEFQKKQERLQLRMNQLDGEIDRLLA